MHVAYSVGRRITLPALLLSALLFAITSCTKRPPTLRIALITPLTTSELWKGIHAGAYKACSMAGGQLYWNGPTDESDYARQIFLVEAQLKAGASGVLLAPAHASALIPAVAAAQQRRVPIVLAGSELAVPLHGGVAVVKNDDATAGRMAVDFIVAHAKGRREIAIAGIDATNSSSLDRAASFEQNLRTHPEFTLVEKSFQSLDPFPGSGEDPVQLLVRHPALAAIFVPTSAAARQVHVALEQMHASGTVMLIMCDQDNEAFEEMRRGEVDAIIAENVYTIGRIATEEILSATQRGTALHGHLVAPLLVTREVLDQPDTQTFLKPYLGFDR